MIWSRATDKNGKPTAYGLVSACERFRIGKYILTDRTVYRLWDGLAPVGTYPSSREAKEAATRCLSLRDAPKKTAESL